PRSHARSGRRPRRRATRRPGPDATPPARRTGPGAWPRRTGGSDSRASPEPAGRVARSCARAESRGSASTPPPGRAIVDERLQRVHRMSGLARPLDPEWRSNRAVLGLMPAGAALAATRAMVWPGPGIPRPLAAAPLGALAVLAAWALACEVSPDRLGAAFLSRGLGLASFLAWPDASVLLALTTMLAVRMVSRSTGLPPRVWDSAALLGLLAWITGATGAAGVLLVGALAFALDGVFPGGRPHQWGFAALSLVFVGLEAPPRDPAPAGAAVASLGALPLAVVVLVSL